MRSVAVGFTDSRVNTAPASQILVYKDRAQQILVPSMGPISVIRKRRWLVAAALVLSVSSAHADQSQLVPDTQSAGPTLTFDWPAIEVGIASYEEGPTGVTVFRFPNRASAAVDVRGGAPGTVNTDALRLGYSRPFVDAIVFSGGSNYGEEAITAVMTGLKDDGVRNGQLGRVAFATGAIIYDFLGHRLNEIYPDKRLAQAALHALRPGVFPLGAQGAGRMAMQGGFFGCAAHSGQGGAFRQVGDTKIAAFVVVNALGAITDQDGRMVSCHRNPAWGNLTKTSDLLARAATLANPGQPTPAQGAAGPTSNTTISLIVTNRKMTPSDLQRLAVQVHTSMARAIQPFSTYDDGDTLFAVSTQEVGDANSKPSLFSTDFIAAETMWDAILASVPDDPIPPSNPEISPSQEQLAKLTGLYKMGPSATLAIHVIDDKLTVTLAGRRFFDLGSVPTALHATSPTDFYVDSRYGTRFDFTLGADGRATGVIMNPGRWAEKGERISN